MRLVIGCTSFFHQPGQTKSDIVLSATERYACDHHHLPVHLPPSRYPRYPSLHVFFPTRTFLLIQHLSLLDFSYPAVIKPSSSHHTSHQLHPSRNPTINCLLRLNPNIVQVLLLHHVATGRLHLTPRDNTNPPQCIFLRPQSRATCSRPSSPVCPQHSSLHDHHQPSYLSLRLFYAREPAISPLATLPKMAGFVS